MLVRTLLWIWMKSLTYLLLFIPDECGEWATFYALMTKNVFFAMQLLFILNGLKLTLVQNIFFYLGLVSRQPPRGGAWKHIYMGNTRLDVI